MPGLGYVTGMLIKVTSFHWEVIRVASLGLSGNGKLLGEQLFNELTTAYG